MRKGKIKRHRLKVCIKEWCLAAAMPIGIIILAILVGAGLQLLGW